VKDIRDQTHISIIETKTRKAKRFKINNSLQTEIGNYTGGMFPDEYLFARRTGHKDLPISRVMAYLILNGAARKVGITDPIGTHTLRKTFGYFFYLRTKDIALLQKLFNHSSPSITLRYIGITQDSMDKAIENFSL